MKHNFFLVHSSFARVAKLVVFVLISGLASSLVIGCGDVGSVSSSEDARAQQAREAKALEDLYSGVVGVWEGTVSNASTGLRAFRSELLVFVDYVQNGTNSDGSPRLVPALRGRFRPSDFATDTDDIILVGDYDRSGRLVLTAEGSVPSGPSVLSIRGSMAQGKLSLEVSRRIGTWGFLEAVRTKPFASAPVAGESDEDRERFQKIYGPIQGRYYGRMKSVGGNDYMVSISIGIIDVDTAAGLRPTLTAHYERLDEGPGKGLESSMSVRYDSQTGKIFMRNTADGKMGMLSVSGSLVTVNGKKTLLVSVSNKFGPLGELEAVRN